MSLSDGKLAIAERCFAALGDISTAHYLRKIREGAEKVDPEEYGVYYFNIGSIESLFCSCEIGNVGKEIQGCGRHLFRAR